MFETLITNEDGVSVVVTRDPAWVERAQRLRFNIFFPEQADPLHATLDSDEFDEKCDHLLVLGKDRGLDGVIGTYRLRRFNGDLGNQLLYTQTEFDVSKLLSQDAKFLELGRSCIHPDYRNGTIIQMLWKAIAEYIFTHDIHYLFGCASFPGADAEAHRIALSYLHHYHPTPEAIRPFALPGNRARFDLTPQDELGNVKRVFAGLPALIKGYLRLGAYIGEGAVLDPVCDTTDVCIVLERDKVTDRYYNRLTGKERPA